MADDDDQTPETITIEEHTAQMGELNTKIQALESAGGIFGEGLKFNEGWKEKLPEEFREDPLVDKFKDLPSMLKSHKNLESMIGKTSHPDESWDQDQIDAYYEKNLGWDPSRESMKVEKPAEMDERLPWDEESINEFLDVAHGLHLKPQEAQKMIDWYYESQARQLDQLTEDGEAQKEATMIKLKEEIGDAGLIKARKVSMLASNELGIDVMADPVLANNEATLKLLNWASQFISEAKLPVLDSEITVSGSEKEIQSVMNDPDNRFYKGYRNQDTPHRNKLAQEHMARLFRIKNKGQ